MSRTAPRLALAVVIVCLLSVPARADFVTWSYTTTPAQAQFTADGSSVPTPTPWVPYVPKPTLNFIGEKSTIAVGDSNIVLADLTTTNTLPNVVTWTNRLWSVDLTLTDTASGNSYDFIFGGRINGSLSNSNSTFTNTFVGATTLTEQIGSNDYTVTLTTFSPPGPPSASNRGAISAFVSVSPASGGTGTISSIGTPEPSTMILAGLGLVGVVATRFRRRRQTSDATV